MFAIWNGPVQTWSIADFLILIVVVAGGCAVVAAALRYFEITLPPPIIKILYFLLYCIGIVFVVAIAVWAIRALFSM